MSLEFNVSQLLKSGVGETRVYPISSDEPIDLGDGAYAVGVRGEVKFTLTNYEILAAGRATATIHQACARCMEPFEGASTITFDEEYQPAIDISTGLPSVTPLNDDAFRVAPNHTVDLTEAIRQNLVVALDIIPVCSQGCRGLCPTCGANLNIEPCACSDVPRTNPFAALQGLLSDGEAS